MKHPLARILCGLLLAFGAIRMFNLIVPETPCPFWPSINTVYGSGYNDRAFAKVKVGMSAKEVRQLVGLPLDASFGRRGNSTAYYSLKQYSRLFGDWAHEVRWVHFQDGIATRIVWGTARW